MEIVAIPVPGIEELDAVALIARPRVAVGERGIYCEDANSGSDKGNGGGLAYCRILPEPQHLKSIADEVVCLAESHDSKI